MVEFKAISEIKESMNERGVEFLYLGHRTSHPNDRQLWKNVIKKYNLEGWHSYMGEELDRNVWKIIEDGTGKSYQSYPRYLFINNKSGKILYNASWPSQKDKLMEELKEITNRG